MTQDAGACLRSNKSELRQVKQDVDGWPETLRVLRDLGGKLVESRKVKCRKAESEKYYRCHCEINTGIHN